MYTKLKGVSLCVARAFCRLMPLHNRFPVRCVLYPQRRTWLFHQSCCAAGVLVILTKQTLCLLQKVTRIRRSPFTDASDSSDDECRSSTYRRFSPRRHSRSSRNLVPSGEVVPASPSSVATQQWKNGSPGLARAIKRGEALKRLPILETSLFVAILAGGTSQCRCGTILCDCLQGPRPTK